jgi:hypothetical protein
MLLIVFAREDVTMGAEAGCVVGLIELCFVQGIGKPVNGSKGFGA